MDLSELIKNDLFQLTGWVMTVIGGLVAIIQTIGKSKAQKQNQILVEKLRVYQNQNSISSNNGKRKIHQGDGSQYIESTTGPLNIKIGK